MSGGRQSLTPQVEFVITAPEPYGAELAYRARARMTLGVLVQLVSQARQSLVIAAPYFQPTVGFRRGTLSNAIRSALQRGVSVDVVSTKSSFESVNISQLRAMTNARLRFFRPLTNIQDEERLGSHAKFCVADGESAYIGSANLTGAGLFSNLEMGLLVHGELAYKIDLFWKYLIEIGFFVEVQSN